jgi:hypothetical protein
MKFLILVLATALLFTSWASAATITAATCSQSDVQTALNSVVADGTTVIIPSSPTTCTWTTAVTYNQVYSTTIQGSSTTTGSCAPGGTCTATDNTTISLNTSGTGALNITTVAGKSFRMTGLTLIAPSSLSAAYGRINIGGSSTSVRIDHNHFNDQVSGEHLLQIDGFNGVIDHNFFDSTNQANVFFMQTTNGGSDGSGNQVWAQPDNFGTSGFIFAENNLFQNGTFVFDNFAGGRLVLRYNIVGTNSRVQTHGTGSGHSRRSGRATEIYGNTFTFATNPSASNYFSMLVDLEGGTGVAWNNIVTGFGAFIREDVVRTNSATYPQSAPPASWGYCGTSANGSSTNWDGNTNSTGYPCVDQVGRGAGDLLTGYLTVDGGTGIINSITGTVAWPHQALVPWYAWNNTINPINDTTVSYWANLDSVTVENRDYYLQLPNINESATFNGTAGVGQGLFSTKPATCTPGVGYWATDNNTLYQCQGGNTWTSFYSPYTYPHPLVSGGPAPTPVAAPNPPTNLRLASVQ